MQGLEKAVYRKIMYMMYDVVGQSIESNILVYSVYDDKKVSVILGEYIKNPN